MTDRFYGALFGLAYGDAISFPALFHRFQAPAIPRKRHNTLWQTNQTHDSTNIARLMLPFTHRLSADLLEPCPTYNTEFAMLTLKALIEETGAVSPRTFLSIWQREVVPNAAQVRSSFSERAAIENLKRGLLPPATGNDNPLHYEDCAAIRAVSIGLYAAGDPDRAVEIAEWDAQISQAEDGIYAAKAMAATISVLAAGKPVTEAIARGRQEFPKGSWITQVDSVAQQCAAEVSMPADLVLLLSRRVINTVYSYGNAAPETIPAAFVLAEKCAGDLKLACAFANQIAKSADSLPALVGAICGCHQGDQAVTLLWREALNTLRGLCLPFMAGITITEYVDRLRARHRQETISAQQHRT
ncbi:MAG: ADP-ribosylglycohydrolase family protein [Anaerolineae bacterium]|nr:ADP-ribosylglycohydrolase family protein [Anaerolineae bacterium]